jgi:hypothetical protein
VTAAIVGTVAIFLKQRPKMPSTRIIQDAKLKGNYLTAYDSLGTTIWTKVIEGTLQHLDDRWRAQVLDLKGDGHPGVLAVCSFQSDSGTPVPSRDELRYYTTEGKLEWTLPCEPPLVEFNGQRFATDWRYSWVLAAPAGGELALWVAAEHRRWPGCVLRVDARGRSELRFANAGNVECICLVRRTDGDFLAIAGENNEFDCSCLAVIGVNDPPSSSPSNGSSWYRFANAPTSNPRHYVRFPVTDITKAHGGSYGHAQLVYLQDGGIAVEVGAVGRDAYLLFEFTDYVQPKIVAPSGSYLVKHAEYEHKLGHPWTACPEREKPLTIQHWEPEKGWRDESIPWRLPNNRA